MQQGRLYLVSANPIADGSSAGNATLFFGPDNKGNQISLYNGSQFVQQSFSEVSLSNSGLSASTMYDVYISSVSDSSVTGHFLAWSGNTEPTRALQNGVLVNASDSTQLYVGSVYVDSYGNFNDYPGVRTVWNFYNQVSKKLQAFDPTPSWTASSSSPQPANSNTTFGQGRFGLCTGLQSDALALHGMQAVLSSSDNDAANFGFGIDSTSLFNSVNRLALTSAGYPVNGVVVGTLNSSLLVGFHFIQRLEASVNGNSLTFYGSGLPLATTGILTATIRT